MSIYTIYNTTNLPDFVLDFPPPSPPPRYTYATLKGKSKSTGAQESHPHAPAAASPPQAHARRQMRPQHGVPQNSPAQEDLPPVSPPDSPHTRHRHLPRPDRQYGVAPRRRFWSSTRRCYTRRCYTQPVTETSPFADGMFGLVTARLALHNAKRGGENLCRQGDGQGCVPPVGACRYFKDHGLALEECGMQDVRVGLLGFSTMIYGTLPCRLLAVTRPC